MTFVLPWQRKWTLLLLTSWSSIVGNPLVFIDFYAKTKEKDNIYIYTYAGLSYHICGKLEVAFKASPSSQHQHCTDEAQNSTVWASSVQYLVFAKSVDSNFRAF